MVRARKATSFKKKTTKKKTTVKKRKRIPFKAPIQTIGERGRRVAKAGRSRAIRFGGQLGRRTPPIPTTTITRISRPTTRPTRRPTTVFRPTPRPRDDFERSLTPPTLIPRAFAEPTRTAPQALGVSVRELLGVSPERIPPIPPPTRETVTREISTIPPPQPREVERPTIVVGRGRGAVRPTRVFREERPRDDLQRTLTPIPSVAEAFAEEPTPRAPPRPKVKVPIEVQRENVRRLIEEQGLETFGEFQARELDPATRFIQSFGGGARQEFENIGAIAGIGTPREEVGSLAVDLPFAVGEALLTREAPEGEGFFGLGFDFRPIDQLGVAEAQRVSGVQQEKIGRKFAEDPARALGSIATIGTIEAGLFVATGGIGNLARRGIVGVSGRIATKKQRKIAEELAEKAHKALDEPDVARHLEPIGDGRFILSGGIDGLGQRGVSVIRGNEAVIARTTTDKAGNVIEVSKKIKLFKGVKPRPKLRELREPRPKLDATELELRRLGLTTEGSPRAGAPRAVLGGTSEVPAIIIDTKTRTVRKITGEVIKEPPRIIGFNRKILAQKGLSPLQRPELVRLEGVQTRVFQSVKNQIETGLRPLKGKSLTIEGKPTDSTLSAIRAQERLGFTQPQARGLVFLTDDALKNPKEIFGIIKTQKTLPREAFTPEELRTGIVGKRKLTSLDEITSIGERPLDVPTFEIFGTQALSQRAGIEFIEEASKAGLNVDDFFKGIVKSGKSTKPTPKAKAPTFDEAEKALDKFAKEQGGIGKRTLTTKGTPRQRETSLRAISKAIQEEDVGFITTERGLLLPRGVRPSVRAPTGVRPLVVSVIPTELQRQVQFDDISQITGIGESLRIAEGQRLIDEQGTGVIPLLGTGQINIFERPPRGITIPEFGVGEALIQDPFLGQVVTPQLNGGTPLVPFRPDDPFRPIVPVPAGVPPVFPFGELRRRRRIAKRRRSRLGRRIFDVADEPFGAISVGLGFFAEQETGRETIEELIGRGDEPLTRQERQARARLGRGGRRRQQNFAEGFDFSGFFS